jgi:hypothetical protein
VRTQETGVRAHPRPPLNRRSWMAVGPEAAIARLAGAAVHRISSRRGAVPAPHCVIRRDIEPRRSRGEETTMVSRTIVASYVALAAVLSACAHSHPVEDSFADSPALPPEPVKLRSRTTTGLTSSSTSCTTGSRRASPISRLPTTSRWKSPLNFRDRWESSASPCDALVGRTATSHRRSRCAEIPRSGSPSRAASAGRASGSGRARRDNAARQGINSPA